MANYYKVLNVTRAASAAELKSAYRRLARELHPDVNGGSKEAAKRFAVVAKAYAVLSDPKKRSKYDQKLSEATTGSSVFNSENMHVQRMRRMAMEEKFNAIVDKFIDRERRESIAMQELIFPVVTLLVSTFFVAFFKPLFWENSEPLGKIIIVTLSVAGLIHLINRLRTGFIRYTYENPVVHDSLFSYGEEPEEKPMSRGKAILLLLAGIGVSFVLGTLIAGQMDRVIVNMQASLFSASLTPALVFYPPIAVLIVDITHMIVLKRQT
jgi:DnaJ-domain-containing protein 1/succinate dehydrogenase/fumarate reductase cytochrome b subunit